MSTPKTVLHTPLPQLRLADYRGANSWFVVECESNCPGVFAPVALVSYKPHAEYFIDCVNSHDRLVKALGKLLAVYGYADSLNPEADYINEARAALAASQPTPDHEPA